MALAPHSEVFQNLPDRQQEMGFMEETFQKLSIPRHSKNRKSSTADFYVKQLLLNSKEIDHIPEFNDDGIEKDPQIFDQVLLSRISKKASEDLGNRTNNHCYQLIAREYQFAFDKIEVALHQKQTEVNKMKKEYMIQIEEKEEIIEELKRVYEDQLLNQDKTIQKLNADVHRLEQKTAEQEVQIGVLKSENELLSLNLQKKQKEATTKITAAQKNISQLQDTIEQMSELLNNKNTRITEIQKLSVISQMIAGSPNDSKPNSTKDPNEDDLISNLKNQIQQMKSQNQHLMTRLTIQQNQIKELKQYKMGYFQSSSLMQDNLKANKVMLKQIQGLKCSVKLSSQKRRELQDCIQCQKSKISKLQFQNQTLSSYNKTLLTHKQDQFIRKQNKFSMSRLRKQNSRILSTKFFS